MQKNWERKRNSLKRYKDNNLRIRININQGILLYLKNLTEKQEIEDEKEVF